MPHRKEVRPNRSETNGRPIKMTEKGRQALQAKLDEMLAKIERKGKDLGATVENAADWHDNNAYDLLMSELDVLDPQARRLVEVLKNVEILQPRQETDQVGIGNTVEVQYEGEDSTETYTIVGESDPESGVDTSWISFKTPLAIALLGLKANSVAPLGNGLTVKLVKILPGQF